MGRKGSDLGSRQQRSGTSWSLPKSKTRGWGLVLSFELGGDDGMKPAGYLPHLALVIKCDIQQEDRA